MEKKKKDQKKSDSENESLLKPDEKTLHTTDPQEEMKGPISSLMQNIKEKAEVNDKESKEEADKRKDENT